MLDFKGIRGFFLGLLSVAALVFEAAAGELPIFDAHMHYSRGAWDAYSPGKIIAKMDQAGVSGALASSTPDEGSLRLMDAAPDRIVGGFRPYRESTDLGSWYRKPELLAYSEKRLGQGRHRVFGEVHIPMTSELDDPGMARYVALARERGLYFHVHSDAEVVEGLFARWPDLKVLWAHAGFSEPPEVVGRLLDQWKNLWTEVSYRAPDIMAGNRPDPEWRALLVRHADRFMIGTDTWTVDRWHEYVGLIGEHRAWLGKLPPDVAEKIAHKNAERLFGFRN